MTMTVKYLGFFINKVWSLTGDAVPASVLILIKYSLL